MGELSKWFVCPECDNPDTTAKQVLGLGNFSVNIECERCRFRHIERDASSDNWNKRITVKQYLTGGTFSCTQSV